MIDDQGAFCSTDESIGEWARGSEHEFSEYAVEIAYKEYWSRFVSDSE
jgi:hypothetical protein